MACRGVHFAITAPAAERLLAVRGDDELRGIVEEIEDAWEVAHETDKAWDAMARALSDGTLGGADGASPLDKVFFGGKILNTREDYFVVLVTPAEAKEIADALAGVTESWLRGRYLETPFPDYQGEKCDEDWDYTWGNFLGLPEFFSRAAVEGRYVIFTVSQ